MSAHLHYIIACLACEAFFVVLHRKSSNTRQIFGIALIPLSLYYFIYRNSILPSMHGLEVYLTAVICFAMAVFLCTLTFEKDEIRKEKKKVTVICAIVSFFLIMLVYGIPWFVRAFPLDNPDAVLFTLLQNKAGTEGFVWDMIWKNILAPSFSLYIPVCIVLVVFSWVVCLSKRSWIFKFFKLKFCLNSGWNIWVPLKQLFVLFFVIVLLAFFVVVPKLVFPVINLCNAYLESNKRTNSQLYLEEYVFPDSVSMMFPAPKRNLIYIMMESMETNFKEYMPEINRLSEEHLSFVPGGIDVDMTGWTMAAQVAKTCGIPLNLPRDLENSDDINIFLPNAKCLTDILAENGYNQVYVQGSDGTFSSKRQFWNQHGVHNFHDFPYYKRKKIINEKKEIFWGVTDRTLYRLMQKELQRLAGDSSRPFALYAITVDTHFPDGYLSDGCDVSESDSTQFPSVLRCASRMLDSFLNWAKKQEWYDNTTIVVAGDHTWITFTDLLDLPKEEPLYWINFFVNSTKGHLDKKRKFSSFDMYPTVLEALGVQIEGHRLGLGTSLFSTEKTLLERMPLDTLNSKLRGKSYQYDYFMNGGSFLGDER